MAIPVKGVPNKKLREYRKKLGWSQQMVADYLLKLSVEAGKSSGITGELVGRWERGTNTPSPFYQEKLCRLFNVSADALGFFDELTELSVQEANGSKSLVVNVDGHDDNGGLVALLEKEAELSDPELTEAHAWLCEESTSEAEHDDSDSERLVAAVVREAIEWRQQESLLVLQISVYRQIRNYDDMAEHETQQDGQMSRREALRIIAKLPIQIYGLAALGTGALSAVAAEDFLPMCAAGLVAARNLLSTEDMSMIAGVVRMYLPTLESLAQRSSLHQKQAAHLASQSYLLATIVADHYHKLDQTEAYSRAARRYGQLAADPNLTAAALARLAVKFDYEGRDLLALRTYQEAAALPDFERVTPLLQGRIYAGLAGTHSYCGHEQEAFRYLGMAKEIYPIIPQNDPTYHFAYSGADTLLLWEGLVYKHTGRYEQALDAFLQKGKLTPLPGLRETNRAEFLNYMASVMVLQGDLDASCLYLGAAEDVAWSISHIQRYAEVRETMRNMQLLWPREPAVKRLHDKMYERGAM